MRVLVFITTFVAIFAHAETIWENLSSRDWDATRSISHGIFNKAFGKCKQCTCDFSQLAKTTADAKAIEYRATRSELFTELAKEQIDETHCEFHYLSTLDHWGDNDWEMACARHQASKGLPKTIETVLTNLKNPMKINPDVEARQRLVLEQMGSQIIELRKLKAQRDNLTSFSNSPVCRPPPLGPRSRFTPPPTNKEKCDAFDASVKALDNEINFHHANIWNWQNENVQEYVNRYVEGKEFKTEVFLKQALDATTFGSFQKQVIEPSKDQICVDNSYFKAQEKNKFRNFDSNNLNSENKKRDRNFKKLLTIAAVAKMERDPNFEKKYGHLRCQLQVDYGSDGEKVETGIQVALLIASVTDPILGAAGLEAKIGARAVMIAGTSTLVGVNALSNIKRKCLDGHTPETLRHATCEAVGRGQPLSATQQLDLMREDVGQGDCALNTALEALGAKSIAESAEKLAAQRAADKAFAETQEAVRAAEKKAAAELSGSELGASGAEAASRATTTFDRSKAVSSLDQNIRDLSDLKATYKKELENFKNAKGDFDNVTKIAESKPEKDLSQMVTKAEKRLNEATKRESAAAQKIKDKMKTLSPKINEDLTDLAKDSAASGRWRPRAPHFDDHFFPKDCNSEECLANLAKVLNQSRGQKVMTGLFPKDKSIEDIMDIVRNEKPTFEVNYKYETRLHYHVTRPTELRFTLTICQDTNGCGDVPFGEIQTLFPECGDGVINMMRDGSGRFRAVPTPCR